MWHIYIKYGIISIDIWNYRWPTFNISDSAIFTGVIILLFTFDKKVQKDR